MSNLIFLDLETAGLDEGRDPILELAMVAVSLPTFGIVAEFSTIVLPPLWKTVERNLHERVREMHTKGGLLSELNSYAESGLDGASPHLVESAALTFVRQWSPHTPTWHTPLAGCNPAFDRKFLAKQMPKLHQTFSYRNFDCRTLTLLSDWVSGTVLSEGAPHRALPDCKKAIDDVRQFLGLPRLQAGT